MRFYEDGPSIPDQLLERRDQGRVVFLCGAGVSLSAGMPTFYKLTKYVVDFFDPPKGSVIELEFRPWIKDSESGQNRPKTPLDQIFYLLYQEYGRHEVNSLVAKRLQDTNIRESNEHSAVSRISSDQEGRPQIVTTNFDLLFELALGKSEYKIYEPPAFPDISLGVELSGITYLHGRLKEFNADFHSYVLSSADFGRAYLSEGWATNFIRSLLKNYTVVLVGYQAEDPPVKYLLQGLNHDGLSDKNNLYAFDKGEPEEIEAKWRDRGVTAIACKDYPSLWKSFEAWAERADNPRKWRSGVIDMAMKGPRKLRSYERGQVAHLVRTTPGARLFAKVRPSPPLEWLCVFDAWCRTAKETKDYGNDAVVFDSLKEYGLDDDPPRPVESNRQINWVHDHIFDWRKGDTNPYASHRLSGRQAFGWEDMPPRLFHLCIWIKNNLDSPIVAWWAARQHGLHPRLVQNVRHELKKQGSLNDKAIITWNLILTSQSDNRNFERDYVWYEVLDRVKKEGWSPNVLREFEILTSPMLSYCLPVGVSRAKPPLANWENVDITEVADWEVKFPDRHGVVLDIPDKKLEHVFRIFEGQFQKAVSFQLDLESSYFNDLTCYLDRENKGSKESVFGLFVELFVRLVAYNPDVARGYALTWSDNEEFYFVKLKLFAFNQAKLFEADEVAKRLLSLTQKIFWSDNVCRELLFLISDRWKEFSALNRKLLTERLLKGPNNKGYWKEEEYPNYRNTMACSYIQWLILKGQTFNREYIEQLESMINGLPNWLGNSWVLNLTEMRPSFVSRHIATDEASDEIIHLPVNQVVQYAKDLSVRDFENHTEKRPFTGLVKDHPRKALSSLTYQAKQGEYPSIFWSALIDEWPEKTNQRLFRTFLYRLGRLPHELIRDLRYSIGRWIYSKLLSTYIFDKQLVWVVFDHLATGLMSEEGAATRSSIGKIRIRGEVLERSRRTLEHANNSPIGNAMKGVLNVLNSLNLEKGREIPEYLKSRIELLLSTFDDGGDHAVSIITKNMNWLYYLDPSWVKNRVMPLLYFENKLSEPAWSGFLSAGQFPPRDVSSDFKPLFLELLPKLYKWNWGKEISTRVTQMIVELAISDVDKPYAFSISETRNCLRVMKEKNRQDVISRLSVIGNREKNGWSEYVIPFINTVWPRERSFRTTNLVSSWVYLLKDAGDEFSDVLSAVRRFLVPVIRDNHWLYEFGHEVVGKKPLTMKYPADVLELLDAIVPNRSEDIPHYLDQILDLIEEANPILMSDRRFVRLKDLIEHT